MAIPSQTRRTFSSKQSTNSSNNRNASKKEQNRIRKESHLVSYLRLYKHSTTLDKTYMFIGTISTLLSAVYVTVLSYTIAKATNAMVEYVKTTMHNIDNTTLIISEKTFKDEISSFFVVNLILGFLSLLGIYSATVLFSYSALNQTFRIRDLFFTKILNQDISWYDINQTGDFASRVADDLKKIQDGIGEKVPIVISYIAIFITSILQSLIIGWELALVCMGSLPISFISMGVITWVTSKYTMQEVSAYGVAGAVAEEVLSSIRTVVAFGGEKKEELRYNKLLKFACDNNIKRSLYNGICIGAMWMSIYACYALGFWYGVQKILANQQNYDVKAVITVFTSIATGTWYLTGVLPYLETFAMAQGAAVKIFEIIATEPVINASKCNGKIYEKFNGKITFRNVSFSYPSRPSVKVLKNFNLTIEPGQTVALVGSSGCGKSTCIQLIQRYYDPEIGNVLFDNYHLSGLDLTWVRSHIGVVSQEPVLFDATIAENIKLSCQNATQEDIEEAAQKANAHNFIQTFPKKYETVVGQRGTQLSGGQKQRIAIARALIRKPSILLLDEATSALDASSEAIVQKVLDAASIKCTTIIVSHRLSTIKRVDKIVVMSEGRVQEEGTHRNLIRKKGLYYDLVTAQLLQEDDNKKMSVPERLETSESTIQKNYAEKQSPVLLETFQESKELSSFSIWRVVIGYNLSECWAIGLGCICSLINGAGVSVYSIVFGKFIQVLVADDKDYILNQTAMFVYIIVVIAVILGFATLFQTYFFGLAGEKLTMRLRSKMFQFYLSQDMSYFDDKANAVGTLCAKLSHEAASVQGATGQRIGTILTALSTVICALVSSFYFEWKVTLSSFCLAPFIIIVCYWEPKLSEEDNGAHHKELKQSTKIAVEAINGIQTVAALGCENVFYDNYMKGIASYQQKSKRNSHFHGIIHGLSRGLMYFGYAVVFYYGSFLIINSHIEYYRVLIASKCIVSCFCCIANALMFTSNFQKGATAAKQILQVLDNVSLVRHGSGDANQKWEHPTVEYKNIRFSYPSRPKTLVLQKFDIKVLQGKMVALVGPSGCGKSTVLQLFLRFYDPTSGTISVDEVPIHTMHLSALRSQLGVVSQEPVLFNLTIADNISYGDNSRLVSKTEIIESARKANIHNFIVSLPLGYDTKLGEKGTQLSGGQKQRIAIARALIRNPKILLLDEATSALDAENERIVQEALDNASKDRTCITIAHRLNTIQKADLICFIKQGRIIEAGTHSELLSLKGFYYNFFKYQS